MCCGGERRPPPTRLPPCTTHHYACVCREAIHAQVAAALESIMACKSCIHGGVCLKHGLCADAALLNYCRSYGVKE